LDIQFADLVTVALLVALEGLLSADNAMVLAVLVLGLPRHQQKKALQYGIVGAFAFRVIAILLAAYLIQVQFVMLVGAAYLLWLPYNHFSGHQDAAARRGPKKAEPWLGLSAFWATVVKVELTDIVFAIDSILVAVAMSDKLWVIITGGILGVIAMRLVIGQLLVLVNRYPPLVDGAFIIIAWVGIKLLLEYLHAAGFVHFEIPRWLSLGLVVVIFAIAFVYARVQGPVEADPLAEKAEDLLETEDKAIDAVDGNVTK
jgi:YkoY family integral membrane protein